MKTVVNRALSMLLLGPSACAQILDIPETIECGSDDACTTSDNPCVLALVGRGEVVGELDDGDYAAHYRSNPSQAVAA